MWTNTATPSLWKCLKSGPLRIFVVGGGNWGTAISRIAANNASSSYLFHDTVHMYLYDEPFGEGKTLTQVINETHENRKYLPNITLPSNLIAVPSLLPHASAADLIIFVIPHQFVIGVCQQLKGHVKSTAKAISLIKGLHISNSQPHLFTSIISDYLGVPCGILSGANVANDIAREQFSESTLGYQDSERETATVWQQVFDTPKFKINGVPDVCGVEVCGAVKNVVALAAGYCDGLNYGTNTKSALIRIGVDEMKLFANLFFDGVLEETFFDSAGFADVVTTCFGGRNVRCAAEFVRRGGKDDWSIIENDLLNGQKMQGQLTCKEVFEVIAHNKLENLFPLFTVTYKIAFEGLPAESLLKTFEVSELRHLKGGLECSPCVVESKFLEAKAILTKAAKILS